MGSGIVNCEFNAGHKGGVGGHWIWFWGLCLLVCFPPSLAIGSGGKSGCGKVQNPLFRAAGPEYVRQDAVR